MFRVSVSGVENIIKDYEEMMPHIDNAVEAGLYSVASDMTANLIQHVNDDVYAEYQPKSYERTGEMVDRSNIDSDITSKNRLIFTYEFGTESEKPYYRNSDDVIRAIQDGENYPWGVVIKRRPFWDNFIAEELFDGKAETSFVAGLNAYDKELKATSTPNSTILDGNDTIDPHGSGDMIR